MTDQGLEQRLADALERTAPNDLDAILSRCGAQNGSVLEMKELRNGQNIIGAESARSGRKLRPWLAAACAALVLLGAGGGGLLYHQSYAVASVVSLDVNPSIELKVNRSEKVISCTALNTEAAAVLFDMGGGADLKGTKLDVAVNAIVGALVREGYLDSISSAILISVEDDDQDRAARLQAELVASVDGVLKTQAPGTSVLSQVLTADAGTNPVLYGEGLSLGKAALVDKVLTMNGAGPEAFDKLAALSVDELNDLLKAGEKRIPIGKPAAALAVAEYSGTIALSSPTTDVDPEVDEGIYEVELKTAFGEFDYVVDAFTGQVLSGPKDVLNYAPGSGQQTPAGQDLPVYPDTDSSVEYDVRQDPDSANAVFGTLITEAAAKKAALGSAGLSESDVTGWKIEPDWDDGRLEYEIEFWCGTSEYECTVDGHTGSVLKCEIDHHGNSGSSGTASADVGQDAAKRAALSHAGLSEGDVTNWKVERDCDDGRLEYEIEFWCGFTEYEYTIDGRSCSVLSHELDHHSSGHHSSSHH